MSEKRPTCINEFSKKYFYLFLVKYLEIMFAACIQVLEKLNHHPCQPQHIIPILYITSRISVRIKYLTLICFDCFLGLYFKMNHQISINTIDNTLITAYLGQTPHLMSQLEKLEWVSRHAPIFPRRLCWMLGHDGSQHALILIMDMLAHVPRKEKLIKTSVCINLKSLEMKCC